MAQMDTNYLARQLRQRRLELGLTQQEVAGNDLTRGFISQVEHGKLNPSLKSLEIMAKRLNTTIDFFYPDSMAGNPDKITALIDKAIALRKEQHYVEATKVAERAMELATKERNPILMAQAQRSLGWSYWYQEAFQHAASMLERAGQRLQNVDQMLDAVKVWGYAGQAWARVGEFEKAITAYQSAIRLIENPVVYRGEWVSNHANLALAVEALQDYDQAQILIEEVLALQSETGEAYRIDDLYLALGRTYHYQNKFDEAIQAFTKAKQFCQLIENHAKYALATRHCGLVYYDKKEFQKAKTVLQHALDTYESLEHHESAANIRSVLAKIARDENRLDDALALCETALQHLPEGHDRTHTYILKGSIHLDMKDMKSAIESYQTGLDSLEALEDIDTTDACMELGHLLVKAGRTDEACTYLEKAAYSYRSMLCELTEKGER